MTNFTFGRFNIPHLGHVKLFEEMHRNGADVVVWVSKGKKNLPLESRLAALRAISPSYVKFVPVPSAFSQEVNPEDCFFVGEDQGALAVAVANHYGCKKQLVSRPEGAYSSTLCRQLADNNDLTNLVKVVGKRGVQHAIKLRNMETA